MCDSKVNPDIEEAKHQGVRIIEGATIGFGLCPPGQHYWSEVDVRGVQECSICVAERDIPTNKTAEIKKS